MASFKQIFNISSSEIGQLQSLKVLIVTNNQLENLPETICRCMKLNTLHVDKNRLHRIPHELNKLRDLKELSLMGNLLTHIPMCRCNFLLLSCKFYGLKKQESVLNVSNVKEKSC